MYCRNCGKKIRDKAEFCSRCGFAVEDTSFVPGNVETTGTTDGLKIKKTAVILAAVFLSISVCLIIRSAGSKSEIITSAEYSESNIVQENIQSPQNTAVEDFSPAVTSDVDILQYPKEIGELPPSLLEGMVNTAREVVNYNVKNTWGNAETLESMEFENAYLLSGDETVLPHNYLGVVFKVRASVYMSDLRRTDTYEYYYSLVFKNVERINDEWQLDLKDYSQPNSQVDFYPGSYHHFYYFGYENWEALKAASINPLLGKYSLSTLY